MPPDGIRLFDTHGGESRGAGRRPRTGGVRRAPSAQAAVGGCRSGAAGRQAADGRRRSDRDCARILTPSRILSFPSPPGFDWKRWKALLKGDYSGRTHHAEHALAWSAKARLLCVAALTRPKKHLRLAESLFASVGISVEVPERLDGRRHGPVRLRPCLCLPDD